MRKINLGIIGLGTIGEGVYKILKNQRSRIKEYYDVDINLIETCDISPYLLKN